MVAVLLRRCNFTVAVGTSLASRVLQWNFGVLNDRESPVVAPHSEAERNEKMPHHEVNNDQSYDRNNKVAYLLRYSFPHKINPV
jgi:hypothetical protein